MGLDYNEYLLMRMAGVFDEDDTEECDHPDSERWPVRGEFEVCAMCGAFLSHSQFVACHEPSYMHVMDEDEEIPF